MRLGFNYSPYTCKITWLHSTHLSSVVAEDATAPDLVFLLENESQPSARHGEHNMDTKLTTERHNLLYSIIDASWREKMEREGEREERREGGREGEKKEEGRRGIVWHMLVNFFSDLTRV